MQKYIHDIIQNVSIISSAGKNKIRQVLSQTFFLFGITFTSKLTFSLSSSTRMRRCM